MIMLRRLGLVGFDGLSLFRCRHAIGRRPIRKQFFVLSVCSHRREVSDSPAAGKDPRWAMLQCLYGIRINDSIVADPNTVADSLTSTGEHLRVSFGRSAPPASSSLYYDWPDSLPGEMDNEGINVIAAHGDSALLEMRDKRSPYAYEDNYFVYRAGGGAARPPSLTLLPPAPVGDGDFPMGKGYTGVLRRGDDDLLVVWHEQLMAECVFHVHRHGTSKWELEQAVPILDNAVDISYDYEMEGWATVAPVPVGDRFLCWVKSDSHFLLSDMADETSPKVRYVPLPPDLSRCGDYEDDDDDDQPPLSKTLYTRNICATGESQVKFVRVEHRCCCCGGPGKAKCARLRLAFTVNTWTMNLSMDAPLTWEKDGVLDCEEIWALPEYQGLPRACLECPIVSLDNPDVICFTATNSKVVRYPDCKAVWIIQLDMRSKTLLSVAEYTTDPLRAYYNLPAKLYC